LKDLIHYGLEGSGAVGHFEEHHERFKEATVSAEGCFPFISELDTYIIEAPVNIEFCKVSSFAELRDEFRDKGERISVLDGHSVQRVIVLDQLEQTIFFFNKEHRDCNRRFGRSDLSGTEVFLQESVQLLLL